MHNFSTKYTAPSSSCTVNVTPKCLLRLQVCQSVSLRVGHSAALTEHSHFQMFVLDGAWKVENQSKNSGRKTVSSKTICCSLNSDLSAFWSCSPFCKAYLSSVTLHQEVSQSYFEESRVTVLMSKVQLKRQIFQVKVLIIKKPWMFFFKNIAKLFCCRIMIIKYSIKYQDVKMAMTEHLLPPQEEVVLEGAKSGEWGWCYTSSNRHPWIAAITTMDLGHVSEVLIYNF